MRGFLNPVRWHLSSPPLWSLSIFQSIRWSTVVSPPAVFPSLVAASAALYEACECSGTPRPLVETALDQIRGAISVFPTFEVTSVQVFTPPLPEKDMGSNFMLLFRGTPDVQIESYLSTSAAVSDDKLLLRQQPRRLRRLFFTSSFRVALPYGKIGNSGCDYRIVLCRIERRPGGQLFNRLIASEKDLKLLESVEGDMRRFKDGIYDGQVDWLDDGATYCFDANDVRMHTLMCMDIRC